jgi:outer membrane immunogenic protein
LPHRVDRRDRPLAARHRQEAADLGRRYEPPPAFVAPAVASWSGFYVGINGGYGWATSDWTAPAVSTEPGGGVVGGTIGYNFQAGGFVFGLEGDVDWADMKGSVACSGGSCESKADWFATARGRIGYAGWSNWLPYLTGGAAFAGLKATNGVIGTSAAKTQTGWTLGGGVEYALLPNWSVKLEYLYADLGKFDCGTACSATVPDDVDFKANIVRAGLNYRF